MSTQVNVTVWEPSPSETWAAELLSQCHTQTETAEIIGCDSRTIRRYWQRPEFRALVRDLVEAARQGYDQEFAGLIADALRVERMGVRGEIEADSARCKLAHDILSRTAFRIAVRQADDRASLPQPVIAGHLAEAVSES